MLPRPVSMAAVLQRAQINTFARSYRCYPSEFSPNDLYRRMASRRRGRPLSEVRFQSLAQNLPIIRCVYRFEKLCLSAPKYPS
jgi:hypothetical protein